jgi:hypothetical protein
MAVLPTKGATQTEQETEMKSTTSISRVLLAGLLLAGSTAALAARGGRDATMTRAPTTGATHAPAAATPGTHATTTTASTVRGPSRTGQPMVECGTAGAMSSPGNAAAAPGSAFNEDGKAGSVYAGTQPQNSRNTASVSQYDAACAHAH